MGLWEKCEEYASLALDDYSFIYDYDYYVNNPDSIIREVLIKDIHSLSADINLESVLHKHTSTSYTNNIFAFLKDDLLNLFETGDLRLPLFTETDTDGNIYYKPMQGFTAPFTGVSVPEIILNRAEANARLGFISEAMDDLNTLRSNRFDLNAFADQAAFDAAVTLTANNTEEAIQTVLDERQRKLMFFSNRWFDMRRLMVDGRHNEITRVTPDGTFTLTAADIEKFFIEISPVIKEWNPLL
jgi:hypothetical protein